MKETSLLNKLLVISLFLFTIAPCYAKRLHPEAEYQKAWCDKRGGLMEYKLSDKTRVDCLLPNMAVEFDFANKWAECIGQAIYYGRQTNRQAATVLIKHERKVKKWIISLWKTEKKILNIFIVYAVLLTKKA